MSIRLIICLIIIIIIYYDKISYYRKPIIAIANINMNGINGNIMFYQIDKLVLIDIDIRGLPKDASLGFHIHEAGDITDNCRSACSHFNPFNTTHGGPKSINRHVGDLGNIITDSNGTCRMKFTDHMIKLDGDTCNIIGRSIVIHSRTDDLGCGSNDESLITGNAGSRIACSVIGYSKKMFKN